MTDKTKEQKELEKTLKNIFDYKPTSPPKVPKKTPKKAELEKKYRIKTK